MEASSAKIRADQLLVDRRLAPNRSRGRDMIIRRCVMVDGQVVLKPGTPIRPDCSIAVNDPAAQYVSRAAVKLLAGLDAAAIDVKHKRAIDLGSSTGGFTQVLLERGAQHVTAIDVGHSQMSQQLEHDSRVTLLEGFNARHVTAETKNIGNCEIVVSDLSFVSLTIAAEPALIHAHKKANAVLLVKPQFEVGRDGVGKGGIVTNDALISATNEKLKLWFEGLPGWRLTHFLPSPIKGGDGNSEFLMCGERS